MNTVKEQIEQELSALMAKMPHNNILRNLIQQYKNQAPAQDLTNYEFELLVKIITALDAMPEHLKIAKDQIISTIKIRQTSLSSPPPKKIHFCWLGKPGDIQLDYIRQWIKTHPTYEVNLWYDKEAILSRELFMQILKIANADAAHHITSREVIVDTIVINKIIELQNKSHQDIKQRMSDGESFDTSAMKFMVENCGAVKKDLEEIVETNQAAYNNAKTYIEHDIGFTTMFKLKPLSYDVIFENHPALKSCYLQELSLRQNLAAATDIIRLLVIEKEGGFYFDADVLPPIAPEFSKFDEQQFFTSDNRRVPALLKAAIALEELDKAGELRGRQARQEKYLETNRLLKDYPHQLEIDETRDLMQEAIRKKTLFTSLDAIRVTNRTGMMYLMTSYLNRVHQDYNNNAIVARKNSPLVTMILQKIAIMYQFIAEYNIDGTAEKQAIPSTLTQKMREELTENDFVPLNTADKKGSQKILTYRFDGISSKKTVATVYLTGPEMYLMAERALFKNLFPLSYPNHKFISVKSCMGLGFEHLTDATEEDSVSSWIGSGMMEYRDIYTSSSRYNAQIIIQLNEDPVSEKAALYLYNKRAPISKWYVYNSLADTLKPKQGANAFVFEGYKRVVLLGHGEQGKFTMGKLTPEKIAQLIELIIPEKIDVQRLSLVGCHLGQELKDEEGPLPDGFAKKLLSVLTINVEEISLRNALVTVDVLGRKGTGEMNDVTGEIKWSHNENSTKFIINKNEDNWKYRKAGLSEGILNESYIIPSFDASRFGISHKLSYAEYNPDCIRFAKFEDDLNNNELFYEDRLKIMLRQLTYASKEGEVLVVADIVALLMGLSSENNHEIVIVDRDVNKLHTIQEALKSAVTVTEYIDAATTLRNVPTYQSWVGNLELSPEQLALFNKMVAMMGNNNADAAFEQLQLRIKSNKFSFYHVDLTAINSGFKILSGQVNPRGFTGFYLGKLEAFYGIIQSNSDSNKSIVNEKLSVLQQNLNDMKYFIGNDHNITDNQDNPCVFYYSEISDNKPYFINRVNQLLLQEEFTQQKYLEMISALHPLINQAAETALVVKNLGRALSLKTNINANQMPVFGGMTFQSEQNAWSVPFIDIEFPEKPIKYFSFQDDLCYRMYRLLNLQALSVMQNTPYSRGDFIVGENVEAVHGLNAALAIQSLLAWSKRDSRPDVPPMVFNAAKVQFYINIAMQGQGFLADSLTAVKLATHVLEDQQIFMAGNFGTFDRAFDKLLSATHSLGLWLNAAAIGLDLYEIINASSEDIRSRAAFQLSIDSSLLAINTGSVLAGMLGMEALSASLGIISTPLMGVSIGGMALYNATEEAHENTKRCGNWLNQLRKDLTLGYVVNSEPNGKKHLIPPSLAAIERVELSDYGSIKFGSQRYQRYEDVYGAILSWMFFGKKPITGKEGYREFLTTLGGEKNIAIPHRNIDSIILPATPNTYYNFNYNVELTANSSNTDVNSEDYPEYETGKMLEKKDIGFLFTYHSVFDHAMHGIIPFYEKTTVQVDIFEKNKTLIFPWIMDNASGNEYDKNSKDAARKLLSEKYSYLNYVIQAAPASTQTVVLPRWPTLKLTLSYLLPKPKR